MELESPDGSKIPITTDPPTVLGRSPTAADPTVSRRHLSLRLLNPTTPTASFQVTGKNPVLVRTADGRSSVYRASEKGELAPGDRVSLSIKNPRFFTVNTKEGEDAPVDRAVLDAVERRERRTRERRLKEQEVEVDTGVSDIELDIDVSEIDPVKEFGFLVIGREFDSYPQRKVRRATKWNWFLEEKKGEVVDDDEDDDGEDVGKASSSKGRGRRKRRGGDDDDDDDDEVWTGESEDEKELAARAGRNKRAKYSTRSKDPKKPRKDALDDRKAVSQKIDEDEFEDDDEDEDEDETLGGFIINDNEEGVMDEEELEDEEEEEELEDEEELDED